jgi:NAD(P)H-flavin reductase
MTAHGPHPMVPTPVRVRTYQQETHDTFTLTLEPPAAPWSAAFRPGQFTMLYAFGVGEVPISMSGDAVTAGDGVVHTIRNVGSVTGALGQLRPGDTVGVRGPFGSAWPLEETVGHDVVLVAGGIGLAPLRPAIYHLLAHRKAHGRLCLLYGARTPADLLYPDELEEWKRRGLEVLVTVDRGEPNWRGSVGLVTLLFAQAHFDPTKTVGLLCGPEVMMRFAGLEFQKRGVGDEQLYVSLERNMQCAIGLCGHCQLGPQFVCMDGPVFRLDRIRHFFDIREA